MVEDPDAPNTMIGREQETWLFETLDASSALKRHRQPDRHV